MIRMLTRSSTRQAQASETSAKPDLSTSNRRRTRAREPKPQVYFSDDSDDDCKIKPKHKTSHKKTKSKVPKGSDSDMESRNEPLPLKDFHNSVKDQREGEIKKPDIIFGDDSDEGTRSLKTHAANIITPRKQKTRISDQDIHVISCPSPPKLQKVTTDAPQTPRHNKIETNAETQTPSRLLLKLKLTSPTHTNGVILSSNSIGSNRKQLFVENDEQNTELVKKPMTVYQNARKALHSAFTTDMPGREKELTELREFIKSHIENKRSGSLYVSGPPGTGKTASLNTILDEESISSELRNVYVNCTAIKSPTVIYSRIAKELGIKIHGKSEKDYLLALESYLKKQSKMILLVLDEIDQLESKNQSILYTIFEWPAKPNSHVILIGIANALDLTDRILPRLQARCELKPKLMHFAPYTKQQIVQIFTARLKAAGVLEVFSPVALQMLAGKVAAVSGDVRRALDIGRRVVELVDQSKNEDVLKPIENLANELVDKEENKSEAKRVELKQVVSVLNNVYGTSQNLTDDSEDTFPLQQKIVVCSLLLILKKARNKDVTIGKLHEVYKRVCKKRNILSVDQAEFVGLCSLIETRGIIRVTGRKEPRLHKVNLEWDEEEVGASLKDKQLMSMILQDESCLGKM